MDPCTSDREACRRRRRSGSPPRWRRFRQTPQEKVASYASPNKRSTTQRKKPPEHPHRHSVQRSKVASRVPRTRQVGAVLERNIDRDCQTRRESIRRWRLRRSRSRTSRKIVHRSEDTFTLPCTVGAGRVGRGHSCGRRRRRASVRTKFRRLCCLLRRDRESSAVPHGSHLRALQYRVRLR